MNNTRITVHFYLIFNILLQAQLLLNKVSYLLTN